MPQRSDNFNSRYGVLGVYAAARSESFEVPEWYWLLVTKHWLESQNDDGGWGCVKEVQHDRRDHGPFALVGHL